ncbi:amyloid-beta A4 precursor protein-binding family A member 1 isoform X2 [Astyanax mexicanus]|uniref:amyloid-beta A4 precursor protein-binding family A member 1 isoform X2 n=1 Tax=Astyanax mexicanus TaxID=7994 RepID=UPI0020CB22DE|nr:amyloid-beta A4 precursor protein-binding family A member 1 isoform X2 [Astyanax mexicanus]
MSQREEPEEAGPRAPPTHRSRQPNGTPLDGGGRPRWRPCQLNSQDGQGNGHHHHHHHYHQQSHQQQSGQSGTSRGPPRHRRRHVPGQAQRKVSEGGDAEPRQGQQSRPAVSRYRRSGERGHHQPRSKQQPREACGDAAPQQPLGASETGDVLQAGEAQSPEESSQELLTPSSQELLTPSSQELLTPSSQEELTPSQEEPTPPPQEEQVVEEPDEALQGLHCSSSTESSLHTHSEQTEDLQEEKDQKESGEASEACANEQDVESGQEKVEAEEVIDSCQKADPEHECQEEKLCRATSGGSKDSFRSHSRRTGPIRVDVPPFAAIPVKPLAMPHFQPQPFSESLRSYATEPKAGPAHFSPTTCTPISTDARPERCPRARSYEEPLSDSSPEPYSDSYSRLNSESYPKLYQMTPPESHRELYLAEDYQERSEEQQGFQTVQDLSILEPKPQISPQEDPRQMISVGSRLHHYDEQSGDEASSPDRGSRRVRKHTQSSNSSFEELQELEKEPFEVGQPSPVMDENEPLEDRPSAEAQSPVQGFSKISGDAISLAIKDIKEAIEEVKTKTVRSPYTPDKPKEPVWVMRRDVSPAEECHPQLYSPVHPQLPSPQYKAPVSDPVAPLGAESSRTLQSRDADVIPSLPPAEELRRNLAAFPTYVDVPGPCDPEDLIDGIIFAASYLGSTQLLSERTPTKSARMQQAQEAMNRVRAAQKQAQSRQKGAEGEVPSAIEVDLFMSTQRIKVLNADTQETMMDHPLRTISYIADIGNMVVLMARRKMVRSRSAQEQLDTADVHHSNPAQDERRQYRMVCHVFESEDAQLIAQSIGQAFSVAYQEFLRANGIDPEDLSQREYSDLLNTQDMYNDDLIHFSKSENCRDVYIEKQKGEILGVVIVESGWGSILPTVIIASLMHAGPAAKSGRLNIGDQIMTVNGTSLVGLPLSTCQSIIKGLKSQSRIKMNIVRCPPVTMVLIRRPDLRYQLGFSVQNGIICSLMRGGIAERGGVRVGHRIIEINGQSVVATPHEKIVHILSNAVGEIHMKTMPAAMYRLLTAQEQPVYI